MDNIEIVTLRKVVIDSIMEKLDSIEKKLMENTTLTDELLTVEQAAGLTKYEDQTIYNLLKIGKIENHGIGRTKRINKKELLEYLRNNAR